MVTKTRKKTFPFDITRTRIMVLKKEITKYKSLESWTNKSRELIGKVSKVKSWICIAHRREAPLMGYRFP